MRDGCVFCDYEGPSEVQERWKIPHAGLSMHEALRSGQFDEFLIFEPLDPVTPGHVLVVPVEHVTDFRESVRLTSHAARVAAEYVAKRDPAVDWNLIVSAGEAATQTVMHLHVHVVPRRPGDGLALPWTVA